MPIDAQSAEKRTFLKKLGMKIRESRKIHLTFRQGKAILFQVWEHGSGWEDGDCASIVFLATEDRGQESEVRRDGREPHPGELVRLFGSMAWAVLMSRMRILMEAYPEAMVR